MFDQEFDGTQIGSTQTRPAWPIEEGLFKVDLDFGSSAFNGATRYLEVRVNGNILNPRQAVRPAPSALVAINDQDTLAQLACAEGQVAKRSTGGWICAEDNDSFQGGSRAFSVSGATFEMPENEDDLMARSTFGGYTYANSNQDAVFTSELYAPVHLPDGAVITALRCAAYDTNITHNIENAVARLKARFQTATSSSTVATASISTTGSSSSVQEFIDSTIPLQFNPVDNSSNHYWLDVDWSVPDEAVGLTNLRFYGCTIDYSIE